MQHLVGMLTAYDWAFVEQAKELRGYAVAQILEEVKHPDARIRLKALDMLGKVTEVALFTERVEVKKAQMSDVELETRIKEKLLEDCHLHTIVRLPNGVFAPYTSIKTNLLFFTKGTPTQDVWFYEHPYPQGVKSYNKTKPMRIEEFVAEKAWWGDEADNYSSRVENQYAWKISIDEIKARNYNLDCKNPHVGEQEIHDPEVLLAQYETMQADIVNLRGQLKGILAQALERHAWVLNS